MPENPRIVELRKRVDADPHSIAFAQLAEEYRRSGNYDAAVHCCRAGLQRHPGYLSARVTLGRALIEMESLDEAQRELELVLQTAPDNLAAIRGLAEIHQRRGHLEQALEFYRRALNLARHDPDLEETVSQIDRELGNVKPLAQQGAGFLAELQIELAKHEAPATRAVQPPPAPVVSPAPKSSAPPAPPPPSKTLDLGFDFDQLLASLGQPNAAAPPMIEALLSGAQPTPSPAPSPAPPSPIRGEPSNGGASPEAPAADAARPGDPDAEVLNELESWLDELVGVREPEETDDAPENDSADPSRRGD